MKGKQEWKAPKATIYITGTELLKALEVSRIVGVKPSKDTQHRVSGTIGYHDIAKIKKQLL